METFTYVQKIYEIRNLGLIDSFSDIFIPPSNSELSDILCFFQDYLQQKEFNLINSIFIIGTEDSLNAWACKYSNFNVICINLKVFNTTRVLFLGKRSYINQYLIEREINTIYDNTLPVEENMIQILEMFLFYHELGHLLQEQEPKLNIINNKDELIREDKFEINDHISEYDADLFAVVMLVSHLIQIFKRQEGLSSDESKSKYIEDLCIIFIGAYLIYRMMLFDNYGEFYIKKHSHPHLIIRINALTIHFLEALKNNINVKLNQSRILSESIDFAIELDRIFFKKDSISNFLEMGKKHFLEISKYIYQLNEMTIKNSSTAHYKTQNR